MTEQNSPKNKIEYYFLRISAERFASDLKEFAKDFHSFSDEQLYGLVSYCTSVKDQMEKMRKELEKRVTDKENQIHDKKCQKLIANSPTEKSEKPNQKIKIIFCLMMEI